MYYFPRIFRSKLKIASIKNTNILYTRECIFTDKKVNQEQRDKLLFLRISNVCVCVLGGVRGWEGELLSDVYSI
jgi:hypothetical protein